MIIKITYVTWIQIFTVLRVFKVPTYCLPIIISICSSKIFYKNLHNFYEFRIPLLQHIFLYGGGEVTHLAFYENHVYKFLLTRTIQQVDAHFAVIFAK